MNISVLIIAHNEQEHIAQCIASVLDQTVLADEIVLVVHNSTDQTAEIAKQFPIKIIVLNGPAGTAYARIRAIEEARGTMILCIDGDSIAQRNWIAVLTETLASHNNVLVGSYIAFKGSLFNRVVNIFMKYKSNGKNAKALRRIWGGSFAFWGKDKAIVKASLEKGLALSQQLQLSRNPDDYWLALMMQRRGNIEATNKTYTTHYPKELSGKEEMLRNQENHRNGRIMRAYVKDYLPPAL